MSEPFPATCTQTKSKDASPAGLESLSLNEEVLRYKRRCQLGIPANDSYDLTLSDTYHQTTTSAITRRTTTDFDRSSNSSPPIEQADQYAYHCRLDNEAIFAGGWVDDWHPSPTCNDAEILEMLDSGVHEHNDRSHEPSEHGKHNSHLDTSFRNQPPASEHIISRSEQRKQRGDLDLHEQYDHQRRSVHREIYSHPAPLYKRKERSVPRPDQGEQQQVKRDKYTARGRHT